MNEILEVLSSIRPEVNFSESDNFIRDGLLDSFDLIALVSALDKQLGISILGSDIVPSNFVNLESIHNLLKLYETN
jgi:acyl carrier protein